MWSLKTNRIDCPANPAANKHRYLLAEPGRRCPNRHTMDDDNKLQFPSLPATKEDLLEYEAIYLAKLTIKMMSPMQLGRSFSLQAGMPGSRKRSLEEDEDFGAMQVTAAQNG
ncbi:Serine/threonine/tyrosine-interacting protein [Collichthys lucidus]|uniref:Serine/threonine/tyrosine-interacting protein n=1 Tax=Collichthys lucidus TaxID=240159 RepID=A0A4U5U7M3_COLLU|nr:Serine/threonine/tyrosine-interacting protein [Collichthys lucidus]